ncbi:CRISPR system Cascade subunit CasE [Desulfobaculum xiamenense]|uniref:CRISPR system Cascade subunit CasE n=1 Tax=Desulfobaculum xiamenense TaxID=995050 RepID=A0A846QR90_9BACT|nr:type I-E CRISPR-associated protein Cas6/Cse3/CasE [Desulfobaculum xiamenense]NJB67905.1 CRISPR system Cascade subunit CasE [Desulfobaculum xiamenense]
MYMSRIVFDPRALIRNHLYDEHQALWKVFSDGPERRRDFLFRRIETDGARGAGAGDVAYLAVSKRPPVESGLIRRVDVKEYAPRVDAGERVLFSLRVNPVRKIHDENGRQVRYDIVQDLRMRMMSEGVAKDKLPTRQELAEEAIEAWLAQRSAGFGFDVERAEGWRGAGMNLVVERYEYDTFRKPKGGGRVTVATVDLRGFATVTDPEALTRALYEGIGPAKAFGCGLLLIRRA